MTWVKSLVSIASVVLVAVALMAGVTVFGQPAPQVGVPTPSDAALQPPQLPWHVGGTVKVDGASVPD